MTVVINDKLTKEERETLLKKLETPPKLFDAEKYFNKIEIEGDILKTQQEIRDE